MTEQELCALMAKALDERLNVKRSTAKESLVTFVESLPGNPTVTDYKYADGVAHVTINVSTPIKE